MNHSKTILVIFLNFVISSKFFVIILKFNHKVMPSKDADKSGNSFNPDQAVLCRYGSFISGDIQSGDIQ